jgi:Family of unknown function (DUF5691)
MLIALNGEKRVTTDSVLTIKHKDGLSSKRMRTDEQLAAQIPDLALPRMGAKARAVFRDILGYEMPPGNGSTRNILSLAEARGFAAHPADWIPFTDGDGQFASLYQPEVDWLSENGYTPYWKGNSLTRDSWNNFKPTGRRWAFNNLQRNDRPAVYDIMLNWSSNLPAAIRLELLREVGAGGSFYGNYPWQVPVLKHFLTDKSEKVRALAEEKLKRMDGLETEEDHAAELVKHIKVENGIATYLRPPDNSVPWTQYFFSTRFDVLANALALHPHDLARMWSLEYLNSTFMSFIVLTGDVETRSIVASRLLEANVGADNISMGIFRGLPRILWERGLRLTFQSNYIFSFVDFLGPEIGTLNVPLMRETRSYQLVAPSVTAEIKDRKLPVNKSWDPLRILGFGLNKEAAAEVLKEALALGMAENNPRLTMLKFNLAL